MGAWLIGDPDGSRRYSTASMHVIGMVAVGFFGLCAIACLLDIIRPPRLSIEQRGLTYERLWNRRVWAWSELGAFTIERTAGAAFIRTTVGSQPTPLLRRGRRISIPDGWTHEMSAVCRLLNDARERWR